MGDYPRYSRALIDKAIAVGIVASASIAAWLWIGSLPHSSRETLLIGIAIAMFVYPLLAMVAPRWLAICYICVPIFVIAVSFRYCGDMGEDGHYTTAVLPFFTAIWALTVGVPLAVGVATHREQCKRISKTQSFSASTFQRIVQSVLLAVSTIVAVYFIATEVKKSNEQKNIEAPFLSAGMVVYWSNNGGISIQCVNSDFDDADLASVKEELERLSTLKILNLSFRAHQALA